MKQDEQSGLTKILREVLFQHPLVTVSAIIGAFGLVNLVDIIASRAQGYEWAFISDEFRPLFLVFRETTRPLIDFVSRLAGFELKPAFKDYCIMGLITAGMRLRSTRIVHLWVKAEQERAYEEKDLPFNLIVDSNSSRTDWVLFYASRALFAFALWPLKLFGASWRYLSGKRRTSGVGLGAEELVSPQYNTFFATVAWAILLLLLVAMTRFGG